MLKHLRVRLTNAREICWLWVADESISNLNSSFWNSGLLRQQKFQLFENLHFINFLTKETLIWNPNKIFKMESALKHI